MHRRSCNSTVHVTRACPGTQPGPGPGRAQLARPYFFLPLPPLPPPDPDPDPDPLLALEADAARLRAGSDPRSGMAVAAAAESRGEGPTLAEPGWPLPALMTLLARDMGTGMWEEEEDDPEEPELAADAELPLAGLAGAALEGEAGAGAGAWEPRVSSTQPSLPAAERKPESSMSSLTPADAVSCALTACRSPARCSSREMEEARADCRGGRQYGGGMNGAVHALW